MASRTLSRAVDVLDDHDELVAAEPADGVMPAGRVAEPVGGLHEQLVPGVVAEAVVDELHPVEIDVEDAETRLGPFGAQDGLSEAILQQRAVRQPRERVVRRLAATRAAPP